MKISISTLGTRGDVQPYVALARALRQAGHSTLLVAPTQFAEFARHHGVPFAPLPGEFLALIDTPEGKRAISGGRGFSAGFKLLKHIRPLMRRLFDAEWQAVNAFGPDVIVHHPKTLASPHIAEKLRVRAILASPLPGFSPTREFPSPLFPLRTLGPLNKMSHTLALRGGELLFKKAIREWRRTVLGLSPKGKPIAGRRVLYAYSPAVLPKPRDWDENICVSGYWFLDEEWTCPADLAAFLAQGEKPIYVGFGSMPGIDAGKLTATVIRALADAGKRGILAVGGGALTRGVDARHVHHIDSAPHNQLLPLMSAALHHGGAGTTGAALRAGLPAVICPFFGDQPFWARRVHELKVGPPPVDRANLTVDSLATAFRATSLAEFRNNATRIAARINSEDGLRVAVDFIARA